MQLVEHAILWPHSSPFWPPFGGLGILPGVAGREETKMDWLDKQIKAYRDAKLEGDRLLDEGQIEESNLKLQEAMETLELIYQRESNDSGRLLSLCWEAIVEKNLTLGDQFLEEENYAEAREHYRIALDRAESRTQKDEIRIKIGQTGPERATTGLEKLFEEVKANPKSPESIHNFATELALEGYYPEAVTYLEQLVELTPDDAEAHFKLASAMADCDRFEEAEKAFTIARDKGADGAEIDYRLAEFQVHRGEHVAAVRLLGRALEKEPDHLEAHSLMAHLQAVAGDYDASVKAFGEVLRLDPDDSESHFELGVLHEVNGKMDLARDAWQKAAEVDPDSDFATFATEKLEAIENEPSVD